MWLVLNNRALDFTNYCISSVIRHSFSFQNNSKNLDSSYKMDLDLLDYLGRVKLIIYGHFRERNLGLSYSKLIR